MLAKFAIERDRKILATEHSGSDAAGTRLLKLMNMLI